MESIVSIAGGLVVAAVGSFLILNNLIRNKKIQLVDWTLLMYTALYGIGFPIVYIGTLAGKNSMPFDYFIRQYGLAEILFYYCIVLLMMISTMFGWSLFPENTKKQEQQELEPLEADSFFLRKFTGFAWLMFFVSFAGYYLYTHAYGGFIGLLDHTIAIRAGYSTVGNPFSFLEKFGQFSLVSAYSFYALIIDPRLKSHHFKWNMTGFGLSFLFSTYVLFSWGGRGAMVYFYLILVLAAVYLKKEQLWSFIQNLSKKMIAVPVIFFGLNQLWGRSEDSDLWTMIVGTISYPFVSFIGVFQSFTHRFFVDVVQAPLYFLPSSLWGTIDMETADSWTTILISGARKGESGGNGLVTGTIPNDFLTFGYMQANVIGVIALALIFGLVLKIIHVKVSDIPYRGIRHVLYAIVIVRFAILIILGGDLAQIIISNWGLFVYLMLFQIYKAIRP
ncbi:oligosaccharide repeat unit polymerase [Atopococcus tabaci]|uniref:oligosaccharide repeat unit polymerase n=1 Tax=Atopococcus tabaci TaxID=269774 RepID=UPI0003F929CF|nr:oligosaccharide repeat unit polymerase [Atopococcus tabaci]